MIPDARNCDLESDLVDIGKLRSDQSVPRTFLMTNSFETGGSERQFAALARSLNPTAYRVYLGCIQQTGSTLLSKVPNFSLGGNLYGWKSMWARLRLADHLRRNNIAIAHAFDFYTNLTLIPAAKLAGVPVVIGSQRQLGDLLSRGKSRAQAAIFRWCDVVVCNSCAAADRLVEQGLPKRSVVMIGNGVPATFFADTLPALSRKPGVLRVGMIARMNTLSKNHALFLRAAARLRGSFTNLEFLLVGDGPHRLRLEQQAEELGLTACTYFLGERRDIPAMLASLDVSVLPSSSESLSNAIIESMAAGVPVVASRVGGNPELVSSDRGALVEPGNEQLLADAIERLLRDASRRVALGRSAKQFAEKNFTLERMRKRHEDLYAELLEKKFWRAKRSWSRSTPQRVGERLQVALVAASPRYVGGQSVQANLLFCHWQNDPAVECQFIPVDPFFPRPIAWLEHIPYLRTLIREPIYLMSLWRGLKDVEIAHIFSASYWSFLLAPLPAWFIARLRAKQTLIHYHSGEARDHLDRFRGVYSVLADADCLAVPSRYLVEVFDRFAIKTSIVPNFVDLKQFFFRERNPLRPHLICTRGFHPYYCVDVMLRAFADVQRHFANARLDLIGHGPVEQEIRTLSYDLKLLGVNFTGAVPHQEIARSYDAADIFINASRLDNMPVSILEAFASGTPVVTTAPEGMAYLVEHERTGLLSEPGDVRALTDNVIRLLRDPELATRLALNAREEVKRYSWETIRRQWLGVYRSLLSEQCNFTSEVAIPSGHAATSIRDAV
jgi:glycosyltransferase involved in cell wall biosynthesis